MKKEEFLDEVNKLVDECPKIWRRGQSVFNVVEALYGETVRDVQFIDRIDCFYKDENIDQFLDAVWKRIKNKEEK